MGGNENPSKIVVVTQQDAELGAKVATNTARIDFTEKRLDDMCGDIKGIREDMGVIKTQLTTGLHNLEVWKADVGGQAKSWSWVPNLLQFLLYLLIQFFIILWLTGAFGAPPGG